MSEDDKLVQFDRARAVVRGLRESLAVASPDRKAELVRLVVERVDCRDQQVVGVTWLPQVRPMMSDGATVGVVPLEGIEPPTQALGRPRSIR
ncbi:MAG: hypothetical protein QOF11_1941 [Chloroflexota bacterium]|nr:hypothetical protein [Chloroflexota bacterium]